MSNYDFFEDNEKNKQPDQEQEGRSNQQGMEETSTVNDRNSMNRLSDKLKNFKFEKIYLAYGLAVFMLMAGAYFIFSTLFASDDTSHPSRTSQISSPNTNTQFVKTEQRIIQNVDNKELTQRLQTISTQLNDLQTSQDNNSQRFEKTIIEMAQHIKSVESNQAQMLKSIQSIIKSLDDIQKADQSKTLISLVTELQRQLQYMNAKEINMNEKLHLTAVIDGIAWLEDKKGRSITVKEGSQLDGYGKVLKIDSQAYKVYTASGFVFE
ncbi:hypothetical protein [Fastidiosibacter lacustris]|uniref:hypothetical protein n=1 Tax=Fastidiosibacter lacustris TaxID=2056695 RepID=UPI000E343D67|nr:hypothetical protein [Fastidiosibacter lacustris]